VDVAGHLGAVHQRGANAKLQSLHIWQSGTGSNAGRVYRCTN